VSPLQFPVLAQKQEADNELLANSTQEEMRECQRVWEQDTWRFFSFEKVFSLALHYIFGFSKVLSKGIHVIIARANVLLVCC
jgi:succinate dehydrogenase hydrophobic anchor subunit